METIANQKDLADQTTSYRDSNVMETIANRQDVADQTSCYRDSNVMETIANEQDVADQTSCYSDSIAAALALTSIKLPSLCDSTPRGL